ncbi:MAG: hypothetical protein JXA33_07465 [Anaerolineae bacterium]|nr:hypothetical protein [Anaerolineae bacterium]
MNYQLDETGPSLRSPTRLPLRSSAPLLPKVFVLNFDPVFPDQEGRRLHEVCRWNDPRQLTKTFIADIRECSGGYVQYRIVEGRDVDVYPLKRDGFRYTNATYMACRVGRQAWHHPDAVDYATIFREFDFPERIGRGEIDEVWLWGFPYAGFWESTMAGPDAYFCNSPPVPGITSPRFITMGFNYERGVGEMLESFGHRIESILTHVFGSWEPHPTHAWNRFTLYDRVAPGQAGCGNIHFAPNSERDYDWGNRREVWSTCDDWLNYPHLTGQRRRVTCADWGDGDIRAHHRWWLSHLPRVEGETSGKKNNWWEYVVDGE